MLHTLPELVNQRTTLVRLGRFLCVDFRLSVGDVDYEDCIDVCEKITTVPGGVGSMTIACLLLNTLMASYPQFGLETPDLTSVLE